MRAPGRTPPSGRDAGALLLDGVAVMLVDGAPIPRLRALVAAAIPAAVESVVAVAVAVVPDADARPPPPGGVVSRVIEVTAPRGEDAGDATTAPRTGARVRPGPPRLGSTLAPPRIDTRVPS